MSNRQRRNHKKKFKEEVVKLILEKGYVISEAARNLGRSKRELEMNRSGSSESVSMMNMQADLKYLRKENKCLKLEREIFKKAATFFGSARSALGIQRGG